MAIPRRLASSLEIAVAFILAAAYFGYVFQVSGGALWHTGLGDWGDPNFINMVLEHWYQSARRLTSPASPPMYAPATSTLGYSVGLVLFAPFYAAARIVFDPYPAHSATILLVMLAGSVSLYVLLRRIVNLGFAEAILLTAFFVSSANVVNLGTAIWSQMASVFLVPPIILLTCAAARMAPSRRQQALAGLSGLLAALLLTQEFYTGLFVFSFAAAIGAAAFFVGRRPTIGGQLVRFWRSGPPLDARLALAAAALAGTWAIVLIVTGGGVIEIAGVRITSHDWWRPGLVAAAALAIIAYRHGPSLPALDLGSERQWLPAFGAGVLAGGCVFLWIYLPAFLEHRTFPAESLIHSLRPFNPGRWPTWDVVGALSAYESDRTFWFVLLVGGLAAVPAFGVEPRIRRYCVWFVVLSAFVLLAPVRFGTFSPWQAIVAPIPGFGPLPGFGVVRDPKRIIYVYELLAVLMAGLLVARLRPRSFLRWSIAALLCLLLVTDWNRAVFVFGRPASDYDRWVAAPIAIDDTCRSFFVAGASDTYTSRWGNRWHLYSVDAAFVAIATAIPTLNGYSAWAPTGWHLSDPPEPPYQDAVADWIDRHQLRGVCVFDIEQRTMTPYVRGV